MSQRRPALRPSVPQSINSSIQKSLCLLARRLGIQTSYVDTAGKRQHASPETLAAILELWGLPARTSTEIREALATVELKRWQKIVEPVLIAWDGEPARIDLRIPAALENRSANCTLCFESGQQATTTIGLNGLRTVGRSHIGGQRFIAKGLWLPTISLTHHALGKTAHLPTGYHHLKIEIADRTASTLIISAPLKCHRDPSFRKSWGAFLPMYAAHSSQSWGAGNFGDWQKLAEWVGSLNGRVVSTLPLLAAFLDRPVCEPSPYSPASRLFWNEFYLDIAAIPEFCHCETSQKFVRSNPFRRQLERFRRRSLIDYPAQMAARRQVLEKLAGLFFSLDSPRRKQLSSFLRERPQVEDYAKFRAACDQTNLSWQHWPRRMRDGVLQSGDYSEAVKNYHLYVQWVTHEQIKALHKNCRARGVQFYLDLPLGVHSAGYDLWRERGTFATGASVGAPPDAFFSKGQNWGFAPLHPHHLREQGYRYLRDVLAFQMRHTGMLRLDHVMSLHRLYWIPERSSAKEGSYVSYPAEELYAILSLESHRHKTVIVGENLGTVPDEVNKAMNRHGLRRMYVLQFAQRPSPRAALAKPPPHSVASLNTHDMPTFAAHWSGADIDDRFELGLLSKSEAKKEHSRRAKLNLGLTTFLVRDRKASIQQIFQESLAWLRSSPADLVLVNLEDLWHEELPQNVPGTSMERPNWRRKSQFTITEIQTNSVLREFLRRLDRQKSQPSKLE